MSNCCNNPGCRTVSVGLANPSHPGSLKTIPNTAERHVLSAIDGEQEWVPEGEIGGAPGPTGPTGPAGDGGGGQRVSLAEALAVPGDSGSHTVLTLEDVPAGASVYAFVRVDLADFDDAPGNISIAISTPEGTGGNGGGGQFTLNEPTFSTSAYVFDRLASGGAVHLLVNAGTIPEGVSVVRALLVAVEDS